MYYVKSGYTIRKNPRWKLQTKRIFTPSHINIFKTDNSNFIHTPIANVIKCTTVRFV